jgi:hypothetical protein
MSGDQWSFFDKLARRFLGDGRTNAEALEGIREHMRTLPPAFWTVEMESDAPSRIAAIRATMPPERTDAEALAMLDDALGRFATPRTVAPVPRPSGTRGPRPMVEREAVERTRRELVTNGEPSGERMIAKRLGVSRDAVRYALGKDRKR